MSHRVSYSVGLRPKVRSNELCILDESDQLIFSDLVKFRNWIKNKLCMMFSATCYDEKLGDLEEKIIKKLNIKEVELLGQHKAPYHLSELFENLEHEKAVELSKFIVSKRLERSILLYCDDRLK